MSPLPTPTSRRRFLALAAAALPLAAVPGHALSRISPDLTVNANSDFAFDLYARLAAGADGGNFFLSPFSISSALAMTAEGARGQTAREMGKVLRLPESAKRHDRARTWDFARHHLGMQILNEAFNRPGKDYELAVANALFGEQTFPFNRDYVAAVESGYGAGVLREVNFAEQPDAERTRINLWVEELTKERIKDLLPAGSINPLTRLVLVNAIYFKGAWKVTFSEEHTHDGDFLLAGGGTTPTQLMYAHELEVARYGAFNADGSPFATPAMEKSGREEVAYYPPADGFSMAELPYDGDELSMLVIAPNDPDGLGAIESKLDRTNLDQWIGAMTQRKINVFMPKFKSESSFSLADTLGAMGMPTAFDPGAANFDGVAANESDAGLSISHVFHKAFVEVSEEGTEAAAATAVALLADASVPLLPFVPEFRADRPFLYLIRDKATGTVLFLGRMTKP